ncbi:MAG: hypothetical protein JWO15_1060 [Sphingomonadales bacterium]|nr:hypothetical protein [Sphingomonadales bacterium]
MFGIFLAIALAAPIPELATLQDADARVAAIAWRLQTANAALCTEIAPLAGFTVETLGQYQPSVRAVVAAQTGLGARPQVRDVVKGAPADLAGLQVGDVLSAINGVATSQDLPEQASYAATATAQAMIDAGLRAPPLVLRLLRGQAVRTVRIEGVPGCASQVEIVTGENMNAQADGRYVQVSGSLVDFAANDDELATVVAHELAHNILHHPVRAENEKASRGIFARFGDGSAELRKTEFEADRLAVWLIARAGYDLDAVVPFWTRLGQKSVPETGPYPDWNERTDRVAAAVAEVKSQRATGSDLKPVRLTE